MLTVEQNKPFSFLTGQKVHAKVLLVGRWLESIQTHGQTDFGLGNNADLRLRHVKNHSTQAGKNNDERQAAKH